ncbi:uncharacterized protein RAG0_10531 [Rhynchosporium agropyri]|uniref:Uncharacterized protein n=1 Tax=Rhynchosporium agropyri TaxID=914238 RepID=A0A1E1L048_9HELO|nr:uncharacterized protein RAG0_10531 [Rhynchosporium agropyri]
MPSIASLSESRNNSIISSLRESPQGEAQLQDACAWYTGYLEFKIREHWVGLFRDLLKKVNPLSDIPYNQDLSAAFEVLKVVVDGLSREGVALNADLVDTLDNEKLLKYTNDERTHTKELVFVVFGWITTLYPAGFYPKANTLRIINSSAGISTKIRKPTK